MKYFKIKDGRSAFWQWDLGRKLIVGDGCQEVHFCNGTSDCSLVCQVYDQDGQRVVDVPNVLLQTTRPISVFAYVEDSTGGYTKRGTAFQVCPRTKPDDYVFTEPERQTWEALDERLRELEHDSVKTVNGAEPDAEGNIEIKTLPGDMEQVAMLIDADMLPAVHDASGAILTDELGNIILRY